MSTQTSVAPRASLWKRVPLVIRALIVGLVVMGLGVQVWNGLVVGALRYEQPLVPLLTMPLLLVLYWLFFSGSLFWSATKQPRVARLFARLRFRGRHGFGVWPARDFRRRVSRVGVYALSTCAPTRRSNSWCRPFWQRYRRICSGPT